MVKHKLHLAYMLSNIYLTLTFCMTAIFLLTVMVTLTLMEDTKTVICSEYMYGMTFHLNQMKYEVGKAISAIFYLW